MGFGVRESLPHTQQAACCPCQRGAAMRATGVGVTDRRLGALSGGGGVLWGLTVAAECFAP
jgi:hypothetical protein